MAIIALRKCRLCWLHKMVAASNAAAARELHTRKCPFKIPAPIERSPTELLEALAGTVNKADETAPHFSLIDDPFTIPTSDYQRKSYLLAKEYGRRTALRLVEEWPTLFMFDRDWPRLAAFRPQKPLQPDLVEPTEANLLQMISDRQVKDAIRLFERMKKEEVQISTDSKMQFYQLLCYYNAEDVPFTEKEWHASRLYSSIIGFTTEQQLLPEEMERIAWKGDEGRDRESLAEKLFNELPKTDETYSLLICGLCKFPTVYSLRKAKQLYQEMHSAGLIPFEECFNLMIRMRIPFEEASTFNPIQWLSEMCRCDIRPSINTFNSLFDSIFSQNLNMMPKSEEPSNYSDNVASETENTAHDGNNDGDGAETVEQQNIFNEKHWELALEFISKMDGLDIEPSLGIYWKTLELSPPDIKYRVNLFDEILCKLEHKLANGQELKFTDPEDYIFFYTGLGIAGQSQYESLLERLIDVYRHYGNRVKIQGFYEESRFYTNYLLPKLYLLTLESFLILYKKFVPNLVPLSRMMANEIFIEMRNRKPQEFCWPLLKRITEDCIASRLIEFDLVAVKIMHELMHVKPAMHLSEHEYRKYLALCDRMIYALDELQKYREEKERAKQWYESMAEREQAKKAAEDQGQQQG